MFDRASHGQDAAGNLPYGQHEPPTFDLVGTGEPEAFSGGIGNENLKESLYNLQRIFNSYANAVD